ncbi:MAG: PorV/PorQ family protein [Candidatus Poribacteria bacterium]
MKRTWLIWISILLFIIPFFYAQAQQGNPASFLEIGAGARGTSLGGAFVALADDVSAAYWNPAGLAQLTGPAISIMDRLSALDTNYANTTVAFPIGSLGTLGLNLTYYGVGDVITYDDAGKETGSLTNTEAALSMSYAYKLGQFLVGGNLKYIYKRLDFGKTHTADGIGFDAALLYNLTENFSAGAILRDNFTITYSDDYKETAPMSIRAGGAYRIRFGDKHALAFMFDLDQVQKHPLKLHFGSELTLFNLLAVRTGLDDVYVEVRNSEMEYIDLVKYNLKPTVGAGLKWEVQKGSFLTMDYALSIQRLGKRSFFTLGYAF